MAIRHAEWRTGVPLRSRATVTAWLGREALLIVGGSAVLALSAQAAVPIPFSPVPITGQTLACLLISALYGSRRGTACVAAYLIEGLCGLPVFAGGNAGVLHMFGPTGGYLVGFLGAAWVVGTMADRGWDRRLKSAVLTMAAGTAVIFACGLAWLSVYVGRERVLAVGLAPFLPGALVKIALAATLLPLCRRLLAPGTTGASMTGDEEAGEG
ncbi:MAG: biotin transporter BioY [Planctomycetota bacterium]|jgi:biotin transport system substrate-specific component